MMARDRAPRQPRTHPISLVPFALVVALASGFMAGCTPNDYGELHQYNDIWKGVIQIDDGPEIPVELTIVLTDYDAEQGRAEGGLYEQIYGRLDFVDEGFSLAAAGDASHWDYTSNVDGFDWDTGYSTALSPLEGREFIELTLQEFVDSNGEGERETYRSNYQAFVDDIRLVEFVRHSLRLVAELEGDELVGFIDEHSTTEVLNEPGESTVLTPKRRGTLRLTRVGQHSEDAYIDETTMAADPFVFQTEISSEVSRAFTISM